jgi:CDGSH-type Zn-finger protein
LAGVGEKVTLALGSQTRSGLAPGPSDTDPHVTDQPREATSPRRDSPEIRAYPDGPFLIRGEVRITDADGAPIPARRRVLALCRCGKSAIAPFCDGNHKLIPSVARRARSGGGSDRRAENG